jgi:hypothetical protein
MVSHSLLDELVQIWSFPILPNPIFSPYLLYPCFRFDAVSTSFFPRSNVIQRILVMAKDNFNKRFELKKNVLVFFYLAEIVTGGFENKEVDGCCAIFFISRLVKTVIA